MKSKVFFSFIKQCSDDRCPQIAAALAYATLLALIPLTVLIYKIYTTAFVDHNWQLRVQDFIFNSFSPTAAEQVRVYLFESAVHASSINIIGLIMLAISVMAMMYTIDSALNGIWKIHKPRFLVKRFIVYLAILVFGPLAISAILFFSTYLASMPLVAEYMGKEWEQGMMQWIPFLVAWVAFAILYKWVPDCHVDWLHAASGATVAACLFEIAKSGFVLYVSYFPNHQLLYGALASVPLLLIWIYLTWLTVLIGAEITRFMSPA